MAARLGIGRLGIAVATLTLALVLWYVLTTLTGIISAARFASPAEVWSA